MVFNCPPCTVASTIRVTPGTGPSGLGSYPEFAEIEVVTGVKFQLFITCLKLRKSNKIIIHLKCVILYF